MIENELVSPVAKELRKEAFVTAAVESSCSTNSTRSWSNVKNTVSVHYSE